MSNNSIIIVVKYTQKITKIGKQKTCRCQPAMKLGTVIKVFQGLLLGPTNKVCMAIVNSNSRKAVAVIG